MTVDVKPSAPTILLYRSCVVFTPHSYKATLLTKVGTAADKHSLKNNKSCDEMEKAIN